jgi:hypothetical protein
MADRPADRSGDIRAAEEPVRLSRDTVRPDGGPTRLIGDSDQSSATSFRSHRLLRIRRSTGGGRIGRPSGAGLSGEAGRRGAPQPPGGAVGGGRRGVPRRRATRSAAGEAVGGRRRRETRSAAGDAVSPAGGRSPAGRRSGRRSSEAGDAVGGGRRGRRRARRCRRPTLPSSHTAVVRRPVRGAVADEAPQLTRHAADAAPSSDSGRRPTRQVAPFRPIDSRGLPGRYESVGPTNAQFSWRAGRARLPGRYSSPGSGRHRHHSIEPVVGTGSTRLPVLPRLNPSRLTRVP